jgi:uncharacterized protein (TIGR02266 family)
MDDDTARKRILVVGLEPGAFRAIDAVLSRAHFAVDRVRRGEGALALCRQVAFDLVIVKHPLPDMGAAAFADALRQDESACVHAHLFALAEASALSALRGQLGGSLSSVFSQEEPAAVLEEVAGRLLGVPARHSVRLPVRLHAQLETGDARLACQTENLSPTGMLVRTAQQLPIGTRVGVEFTLPGAREPLRGEAEVVRHAAPDVEKTQGIGLRFLTLRPADQSRLEAFITHLRAFA